ncbi:MAG: hypothetical protein ACOYOK_15520 [Pseudobdellovibrionaceae bacterium]
MAGTDLELVMIMGKILKNILLIKSIIACFLFTSQVVMARSVDPICKLQKVRDPLVAGRAYKIEFPNGRVITTVGHYHGSRQIYEISDLALSGKLAKMTDQDFQNYISKILKKNTTPFESTLIVSNRKKIEKKLLGLGLEPSQFFNSSNGFDLQNVSVLNHAKQDYLFLNNQLLRKSGAVEFVGYEGTDAAWKNNVPYYLAAQSILLHDFAIRKARGGITLTEADIKSAILSGSNGSIYAYMQDPNLQKRVPMIGAEDSEVGKRYDQLDPITTLENAFKSLIAADSAYWRTRPKSEMESFKKDTKNYIFITLLISVNSQALNMEITSTDDLDQKLQILRLYKYPWINSEELDSFFAALRQRVQLNIDRDSHSARNLAGTHLSGIHFVGLNHLRSTVKQLKQICYSEMKIGNRTHSINDTPSGSAK